MTAPTDLVRRVITEVMNAGYLHVLDELCTPGLAAKLRRAFSEFRAAFPDWHQDLRELVGDAAPSSPACAALAPTTENGKAWPPRDAA